jgi:predicted membrane-bound spermidine synthase
MTLKPKTHFLFLIGTFFSGFASLVYQVVWQRYLAILIGSEAKSSAIVISVFLIGLALGYYVFGKIMENNWSRYKSMKFYGYIELITAIYALMFPILFSSFKAISFAGPNHFLFDVFIVVICLLFPTFLMGGSIPILTTVLPESADEVNSTHAKIYGWNTLGACLGVFLGGFYLIPTFGLPYSMLIAGGVNFALAFIFLNNHLEGNAYQTQAVIAIKNTLTAPMLYILVFVVGSITISLEVILMRLTGLSIGSSNMVFPIVLTIFIFGLGLGSLRLPDLKNSLGLYQRLFAVATLWLIVFLTVPYWGIWAAHIRVSLTSIPTNYYLFHILILLFLGLIIFWPIFLLGQILPITYSLLDKSGKDYGKKCGYLYSFNTIGTAVGGLVFGYLLLYIFDLEQIFKINIFLLALTCAGFAYYEKYYKYATAAIVIFVLTLFPSWNREHHELGVFRTVETNNSMFQGFFKIFEEKGRIIKYFTDGPNSTVTIYESEEVLKNEEAQTALKQLGLEKASSVIMNGKSDGNTLGDYSTMYFTAALPYFFAPENNNLSAAVVGFGTGLSAGVLAQSKDIKNIDLLEISYELLSGRQHTKGTNYEADDHPKINYIHTDAFKHFTKNRKKYDLIITEPSNPWVTGVENLFTIDFLQLASEQLSEKGLLAMWFQRYDSNNQVVKTILSSVVDVFKHYEVYEIGVGDSLIVMSNSPLDLNSYDEKASEVFHEQILTTLKIKQKSDLHLIRSLNKPSIQVTSVSKNLGVHSLEFPKLSDISNKYRFLSTMANMDTLGELEFDLLLNSTDENKQALKGVVSRFMDFDKCTELAGINHFCLRAKLFLKDLVNYKMQSNSIEKRFSSYTTLRRFGFIESNPSLVLQNINKSLKQAQKLDEDFKMNLNTIFRFALLDNISEADLATELEIIRSKFGDKAYTEIFENLKKIQTGQQSAKALRDKLLNEQN